jgi:SPP1 family predicted phage head-tail adaptor
MLPDHELDAIRTEIEALMLPDTAVISRASYGTAETHGYGGTATWAAVGTVAARIDPMRQTGAEELASREASADYRQLTVPHDASIAQGDVVTIGGREYEIRTLDDDHSLRAVRRAVIVRTV